MKRRDLLKGAGTLMLGAPALHAALLNPNPPQQGQTKDLVVQFNGAFAFWQEAQGFKIMAPPIGPDFGKAPHQPWFGTTANEIPVDVERGTNFTLVINGYTPPTNPPVQCGTGAFTYEQGSGSGSTPLFNLLVPFPSIIIGVRPTVAKMICAPGVTDPYCTQYQVYASGWAFVYKNVDPSSVVINIGPNNQAFFTPCFINDGCLSDATLGINLTPLDRHPDPDHNHATAVWGQMLSMYPWMQTEITGIRFCREFNPAKCTFDPSQCTDPKPKPKPIPGHPTPITVGPGSDCESPMCYMGPPGLTKSKYKKS